MKNFVLALVFALIFSTKRARWLISFILFKAAKLIEPKQSNKELTPTQILSSTPDSIKKESLRKPAKANIEYPIPTQGGYQLPPYPINEYTELLREKIDLLNTVLPIENEWTFGSVNKGIYISTRPYEGLDVKMVRGDSFIASDVTVLEWLSVVKSPIARRNWDTRFDGSKTLEILNPDQTISYSSQKGIFPVAARDVTTLNSTLHSEKSSCYINFSINHSQAPPSGFKGRVRAELIIAAWIFTPAVENGVHGINITYLVGIDVKGSIPGAVIKVVQAQTPLCIFEVHRVLKTKGPLPFVIKTPTGSKNPYNLSSDISDIKESIDDFDETYEIEYKVTPVEPPHGRIFFTLPPRAYKIGASITVDISPPSIQNWKIAGYLVADNCEFASDTSRVIGLFLINDEGNGSSGKRSSVNSLFDEEEEGILVDTKIIGATTENECILVVKVKVEPGNGYLLNGVPLTEKNIPLE